MCLVGCSDEAFKILIFSVPTCPGLPAFPFPLQPLHPPAHISVLVGIDDLAWLTLHGLCISWRPKKSRAGTGAEGLELPAGGVGPL